GSQASLAPVSPVLRCSDEHLNEVVMERIVELPLKLPLELRMVEVTLVQIVGIDVYGHGAMRELNNHLYAFSLGARVKAHEGMLVEPQLLEYAFQAGIHRVRHSS